MAESSLIEAEYVFHFHSLPCDVGGGYHVSYYAS